MQYHTGITFIAWCYICVSQQKDRLLFPGGVREVLGIVPETEIDFIEDHGRFYIVKSNNPKSTEPLAKPIKAGVFSCLSSKKKKNLLKNDKIEAPKHSKNIDK